MTVKRADEETTRKESKNSLSLTVVLPAYNEEQTIEIALRNISSVLKDTVDEHEIIVVNDGSYDGTVSIVQSLMNELPSVVLVNLEKNRGFGGAIKAGVVHATKDILTFFPADYPISRMDVDIYMHLSAFYDIVLGYRRQRRLEMRWQRRAVSGLFHLMINFLFDMNFYDVNWIHFYRRKYLNSFIGDSDGVFFLAENIIRARAKGYSIVGVDVPFVDRSAGTASGVRVRTIRITLVDLFKFLCRTNGGRRI